MARSPSRPRSPRRSRPAASAASGAEKLAAVEAKRARLYAALSAGMESYRQCDDSACRRARRCLGPQPALCVRGSFQALPPPLGAATLLAFRLVAEGMSREEAILEADRRIVAQLQDMRAEDLRGEELRGDEQHPRPDGA